MTTVVQDRELAQADGLLDVLRAAEAELRWSYSRMLEVVAELDAEKVAAVTGFGATPRLLAGGWRTCPRGRPRPALSRPRCSLRAAR